MSKFGTYRAVATRNYSAAISSERPATIRIEKCEAAKTEWDETKIPVDWPAALFVRTELVASK